MQLRLRCPPPTNTEGREGSIDSDSGFGFGCESESEYEPEPELKPQQKQRQKEEKKKQKQLLPSNASVTSSRPHQPRPINPTPSSISLPTGKSAGDLAPSSSVGISQNLLRFPQIPWSQPQMAQLPQNVATAAQNVNLIGSLDPHYIEQYSGKLLPFSNDMKLGDFNGFPNVLFPTGAANSSLLEGGSNTIGSTFYGPLSGIQQFPSLPLPPLDLPFNMPYGLNPIDGFNFGMPMALPDFNLAMDNIPLSLPFPLEPAANAEVDNNAGLIPLLCHICPKSPKFSDVSHLLTHISSKSHLAARFKLQLSDKDEHKHAIQQFDQWAEQYGINQLLKNRQDAKEQKKQNQLKRQRGGNEKKPRRSNSARAEVKVEPNDNIHVHVDLNPLNQSAWHLHAPRDITFDDPYQTPSTKGNRSIYPFPDSPENAAWFNRSNDITYAPEITDSTGVVSGTTKLKGVVLPGMNLFDAATPDQRRMRNQKKHESVLENMVIASESIEQTECIWDDQMVAITRTRNVYDSPSIDGSPESRDEDLPIVKKRRGRRAAHTSRGSQRQTRASTRGSKVGKRGPAGAGKRIPKVEEDIDSGDDMGDSRRVHGTNIFGDTPGDHLIGDVFSECRHGPSGAAGSPLDSQQFNLAYRSAMQTLPSNRSMLSMFGKSDNQAQFGFFDKENDRAPFTLQHPGTMPGAMPSYFNQPRQNLQQPNGFNPLCVQRQDNPGFPYLFSGQTFDSPKSTNTTFQPMHGADYNGMGSGSQFQPGNTQTQDSGFDI